MINIQIDRRILEACPETRIGLISASVVNDPTCDELWAEIDAAAQDIIQGIGVDVFPGGDLV